VTTIPVTNEPGQIGVNPITNKIYVANFFERIVWVIDGTPGSLTENSIISTIIVGNNPTGIAIDPGSNKMYVSNGFRNTVSVVDLSINTKVATIPVGFDPTAATINLNTKRIYTSDSISNTISIIDVLSGSPTENMVISTIHAGDAAVTVDINPAVPNPARDPSTDVKDGTGKIIQCSYLANLPHLSKFAIGGIVATLALLGVGHGGGAVAAQPSFTGDIFAANEYPLSIDGNNFKLDNHTNTIPTITEETGKPIHLKLLMYESAGPSDIEHVALYTNLQGINPDISNLVNSIIYENGQPLQITDPNKIFKSANVTTSQVDNKLQLSLDITFAKPMPKSDIVIRAWDTKKYSSDIIILNALQVTQQNNDTIKDSTPTQTKQSSVINLNNSTTNSEDHLMDAIKQWGGYTSTSISDSQLLDNIGIKGQHIPSWVLKTTKWVVSGDVSEQEFENAITYLYNINIIK
jgi:YVTN family beta-propeller protein